ncbi:chemotactic transducer PctB [Pseudomonas aeruginosa]|nr:chemotactic transducer PctB [Pseudomonas aeruginosa]
MIKSLKFSHKILLAAALVVIATFSLFTLYNDSLQRASIREDLEDYLHEMGEITASNVQNWLSGRILLIENLAQTLARDHSPETTQALLEQPLLGSTFLFTYLGQTDGTYTARPTSDLPADYDPRRRPWYNAATSAGQTTLTEPYMEPAIHELVLTIASPARQGGQPFGVVGGDPQPADGGEDHQLAGLRRHGLRLPGQRRRQDPRPSGQGPGHEEPQRTSTHATRRKIGSGFSEAELHGNTRILSFSPVKGLSGLDWYIGISVDKDKAYAMLTKLRTSAIVAALIAVVAIVLLLGMLIRVLMQPLTDMGRAMQDIAQGEGDLTKRLKVTSNDEFGALAISFNRFVERIHESIREVAGTARQLHDVAQLVVNASNSSMANSDEQSNRTNSVAAAINELGAAAQEIARNAADASHHASDANHQAEDGKQVVEQTIRAMNELSEKISASCANIEALNSRTVNIGQILEVIKGISEQTNLLALNAAIEAARAGEAGRGFAVVADEVRNLAHRAQESAQQIQKMIEELQIGAQEAVSTMTESQRYSLESVEIANRAGERLSSVTGRIAEIDGMNQSVATATEEQTAVVDSLNMDITEINTLNQEGVENLQATLRACGELETQAGRLRQLVDSFKI